MSLISKLTPADYAVQPSENASVAGIRLKNKANIAQKPTEISAPDTIIGNIVPVSFFTLLYNDDNFHKEIDSLQQKIAKLPKNPILSQE